MQYSNVHRTFGSGGVASWRMMALPSLVYFTLIILIVRYVCAWSNAFLGSSLPYAGSIGLTAIFTTFSVLHAASALGTKRALTFLVICAGVSWLLESVGIATGWVYGPYHYGNQLGPKLGSVPVIIPFAWFMMIYPSWVIARALLGESGDQPSFAVSAARVVVSSMTMTAWDTVMDPGKALSGAWTWESGGPYFGVPLHNFLGWLFTTAVIYTFAEIISGNLKGSFAASSGRLFAGLPVVAYALVAIDAVLLPSLPELRVVAMFGMGFVALLAVLRLVLPRPSVAVGGKGAWARSTGTASDPERLMNSRR